MRNLGRLLSTLGMLAVCFVVFGLFALITPDQAKTQAFAPAWLMLGAVVAVACLWGAARIGRRD